MRTEVLGNTYSHRTMALFWMGTFAVLLLVLLAVPEFPLFSPDELPHLLLAHLIVELFSIIVCVLVVASAWYTLEQAQIPSVNVVIAGFSSIAALDLVHALTYEGMPPFFGPSSTQQAVYFWLAARSIETLTLAAIALRARLPGPRLLWLCLALLVVALVSAWGSDGGSRVPSLFVPGEGVTPLKQHIEVLLFALHLPIAAVMWRQANQHRQPWMRLLAGAALIGGMGELALSSYHTPSAFMNLTGHFFKIAAYVLIFRGIYLTALRLPYARLAQAEGRLRAMVDSIPFDAWVRDETGTLIIENPALKRHRGSLLGTRPPQPAPAGVQSDSSGEGNALALAGQVVSSEVTYEREGQLRTYQNIIAPVRIGDEVAGTVGVDVDITALKQAQAELAATVELLRLFVRHTPVAVAMVDRDLVYLQCSQRWITDYGLQGREVIGRHHYEVFPDLPERWKQIHERALQGSLEQCDEDHFDRADGSVVWLRWEIVPWPARDGSIGGLILFTQVITEEVQSRQQIELLNTQLEHRVTDRTRELQRVNGELEEFAASVSHDLQAPLRAIGGYAGILKEDCPELTADARRQIDVIVSESARAQQLITDLLRLARLNRAELHQTDTDVAQLCRDVIQSLAAECADRPIEWQVGKLPTLRVDPGLFRQALVNLCSNAVKFTLGRDPAVIRIENADALGLPGEHVLCIRDNGAGFDMQYIKRLFGTFQRLHSDRQFQGTGVGLANVKRIIERHGGRVWATGVPDEGAAFFIAVPATPPG